MGLVPTKAEVYDFLQDAAHMHGVLAYLDGQGLPETAFVAFSATAELNLVFGTSGTSRKFGRIQGATVGFNVTDRELRQTVQLQGKAREVAGGELTALEEGHYAKLGQASRRFKDLPDQHFFLITPTGLRFSDCLEDPWTVTQIIGG